MNNLLYLAVDEVVERIDVLLHQPSHLETPTNSQSPNPKTLL
jgi:hypothetical protein